MATADNDHIKFLWIKHQITRSWPFWPALPAPWEADGQGARFYLHQVFHARLRRNHRSG
jgi:hypothetical protein